MFYVVKFSLLLFLSLQVFYNNEIVEKETLFDNKNNNKFELNFKAYFEVNLDRLREEAKKLMRYTTASNCVKILEHRRYVGCISLFYRYLNGFCAHESRTFLCVTRTHPLQRKFVLQWHDMSSLKVTIRKSSQTLSRLVQLYCPCMGKI